MYLLDSMLFDTVNGNAFAGQNAPICRMVQLGQVAIYCRVSTVVPLSPAGARSRAIDSLDLFQLDLLAQPLKHNVEHRNEEYAQ